MMFIKALLVVLWVTVAVTQNIFVHPGVLVDAPRLNFIKAQVQAQQEPFYTAYQKAVASSYGALAITPQGPPVSGTIECGSSSHPDYGCSADDKDSTTAYVQALLWWITGTQQYANNAILLLNGYSSVLQKFNNSNAPLQAAWS